MHDNQNHNMKSNKDTFNWTNNIINQISANDNNKEQINHNKNNKHNYMQYFPDNLTTSELIPKIPNKNYKENERLEKNVGRFSKKKYPNKNKSVVFSEPERIELDLMNKTSKKITNRKNYNSIETKNCTNLAGLDNNKSGICYSIKKISGFEKNDVSSNNTLANYKSPNNIINLKNSKDLSVINFKKNVNKNTFNNFASNDVSGNNIKRDQSFRKFGGKNF